MKIKEGFVLREVAGNYIVVPIGKASTDFNGIINLNKTGVFLWEQLKKETTLDDLLNAIIGKYDVDINLAKEDIRVFIEKLVYANLLE